MIHLVFMSASLQFTQSWWEWLTCYSDMFLLATLTGESNSIVRRQFKSIAWLWNYKEVDILYGSNSSNVEASGLCKIQIKGVDLNHWTVS